MAHGLRIYIVAKIGRIGDIDLRLRPLAYHSQLQFLESTRLKQIPENCARFDAGPSYAPPAALNIIGLTGGAPAEDEILLRRAFADCTQLELRKMDSGTASVFQGFVTLRDSRAGPVPLPFFIKVDRYPKASKELRNYADCTALFVPFDARPNIDERRCLLGAERGLIVGNFVERSEALIRVVERSASYCPVIDSLFNHALRGWRAQAHWRQDPPPAQAMEPEGAIRSFRDARFLRKASECEAQSRRSNGLTLSPTQIGDMLDALPPVVHRRALAHGDLHGENVVAVDGRAVLIDFVNVADGPLVKDPAALETWLFLKITSDPADWARTADELYSWSNLVTLPQSRAPTQPLSGVWNVIRQIRQFALSEQLTVGEYAQAVAIQLLRHTLRKDPGEQDHRRPTFMKLAANLAESLKRTRSSLA
ncbi:hypothetical protein GCM10028796_04760 [Ramlibacter monticola]